MQEIDNNKSNKNNIIDRIIQIVLIIIIILLLLQNCSLIKKKANKENNKANIIDITNNKCKQPVDGVSIDCLENDKDGKCLVPNFVGQTKKEFLKWLSSISNTIEIEIKIVEDSNYKDGTIISQSVSGISVKELINNKKKLVITIVNNGSLVDCSKNSKNSKCTLPNFVGKKVDDVENWINEIANNIKTKYIYIDSNKPAGTIVSQSVKAGTSLKDILDKGETIIIYISKGSKTTPDTPTPEPTPEPLDDDFYVESENSKIRWQDQTTLNLFEDSQSISKVKGKIAPESAGTYKFILNNGTSYKLKYKILFTETNIDNMNMKFKLKKGDTYIVDHYVSYDQLNIDDITINTQSSDTYYLEWKWVGDNDTNDTQIGNKTKSSSVTYNLKINIEAESV